MAIIPVSGMIRGGAVPCIDMVDVRVSWLQTFVAVAEERHFGRAASRVGHSPSAVSRHVRHLEEAVGRAMFERTTRTVALTPAGRRLYHDIATSVDSLVRALDRSFAEAPSITVGYVAAASEHLVPDMTWQWERRSSVEIQLVPASSAAQLDAIRAGAMDVGLQWTGPRDPELDVTRLLTEPMRVAVPAAHARAGADRIELGDLADATWLMAADRTDRVVRDHLVEVCARRGFTPRIKDAATGHAAQLHLVAAGHGVCLVPRTAARGCRLPVSFAELADEQAHLVAVTRRSPRPAVRDLVDLLATTAALEPASMPDHWSSA